VPELAERVDNVVPTGLAVTAAAFLPFALPDIGDEEIAEVVDTLRSGWVTTGPKAKRFESQFAEFLGDPQLHCVAVNSATAGLHLALEALQIGPGDEVITTTHTFTATAEVVRYLGADVRLVDIDERTMNIDPSAVQAAITPRTRAIIPVHYAGLPADMPRLLEIARRHRLHVVEDAAHALPASSAGQTIGTLDSDATVFSFYANKTITTAEGGMLVTRDEGIAQRARVMRLHGISRDAFDRFSAKVPSWYYEIIAPGFKYNLTDLAASLGIHQLKKAHAFAQRRSQLAALYDQELAGLPLQTPAHAGAGHSHAWHLYVVRLLPQAQRSRDAVIEYLYEAGIGCSVHYVPLHLQPYWRDRYALTPAMFPRSQAAYSTMISLPLYSRMVDSDVSRVAQALREAVRL